jgi:hypothetical protein
MSAIKSVIIRPAEKRYGQDKDFEMSSFLENEFNNQRIRAQIISAPFDAMARIAELVEKLNNVRTAAQKVIDSVDEGNFDLSSRIRELDRVLDRSRA